MHHPDAFVMALVSLRRGIRPLQLSKDVDSDSRGLRPILRQGVGLATAPPPTPHLQEAARAEPQRQPAARR